MSFTTGGRLAGEQHSLPDADGASVEAASTTRVRALLGPRFVATALLVAVALVIGAIGPGVSNAGPQHPKLHSMSPTSGPPGTVVTFEGINLEPLLWVEFDGTRAEFRSISSERFEAIVPEGATRGRVTFATDLRRVWGPVFTPTEGGGSPPPPPPPGDTEAPTAPQNVRVTGATESSVTLGWNASTDNVAVAGYSLYRDGTLTGQTTSTSTTYQGLPCGRSFTFGVSAYDAAGNRSSVSTITASTATCPPPPSDSTPPTAPGNLRATGATQTSVTVAWDASTDNVGVAGYNLYRNGASAGTTPNTSTTFSGLACGTTYTFGVEAYDAASNRSPRSNVDAATSACSTPPPPPPPPGGSCTIANTTGCVPGSTVSLRDQVFRCDRPLSSYGRLPLRVVVDFTPGRLFTDNGAVDLITGCVGDGDSNTIDLIVDVRGDGRTYGPGQDALKVRLGARDIQMTGHADCGPRQSGAHQDGIQLQGGSNIAFVDFTVGNYDAGLATCQGAGGAFFFSGANGNTPQNTHVIRGKYIGCNHALLIGSGTGSVSDAMFRSGRTDGTDPVCTGYAASPACSGDAAGVTTRNLTCQTWNRSTRQFAP
jgi:chitodextrinase